MKETKKILSASRIKTLDTCSWLYHVNYVLKLPQKKNAGSSKGEICHLIFELLINKKNRHHYDKIITANSIEGSPSINRLVKKCLKQHRLLELEEYEMLNKMILVGLKYDFYCEGGELLDPEYKFKIANEKPEYEITGFMDKLAVHKKKGEIHIIDYKSSKQKFKGDDLEANVQAMMYSLASRKIWPDLQPVIRFMFLRFPRQPIQELRFNQSQLAGFAEHLGELYQIVNKFSEKDAQKSFAYDKEEYKWLCQMGSWICPYKKGFTYWVLTDATGKKIKSSLENNLVALEGQKVTEEKYDGCPRFKAAPSESKSSSLIDDFGF